MGGKLYHDDAGVSPVVGVVLMVAITVILATTAAAFVLGGGDRAENRPPEADFTYEYSPADNGELTVIYEEGDKLDPADIKVDTSKGQFRQGPGNATTTSSGPSADSVSLDTAAGGSGDWVSGDITAGEEFSIVGTAGGLDTVIVRIVWVAPSGDRTTVLDEWRGPNA